MEMAPHPLGEEVQIDALHRDRRLGQIPLPPGDAEDPALPLAGDIEQAVRHIQGLNAGGSPLILGLRRALEGHVGHVQQIGKARPGGKEHTVQLLFCQTGLQGANALFTVCHVFALLTGWSGGSAPPSPNPAAYKRQ